MDRKEVERVLLGAGYVPTFEHAQTSPRYRPHSLLLSFDLILCDRRSEPFPDTLIGAVLDARMPLLILSEEHDPTAAAEAIRPVSPIDRTHHLHQRLPGHC